jgi:hypothetical protein
MLEKSYARYEAALHGLTRYGRKLRLDGHKLYEYGRVVMLAERLVDRYPTYKKTGDIAPLLKEIAHFEADPWNLNHYEDGLVPARLGELLHELKQGITTMTLTVSAAAPTQAPNPKGFLTMDVKEVKAAAPEMATAK